ncbi:ubiquitin carboxyl-terminal hydrolase 2-like [Salvia splendens]|uniref:ubiquitin carboxyl-terminal hydrolase 2-like n=1 Tax=Salvia splendens TaxID=180675 RepID=UPI001C25D80B|nr:ubiquitin carboxyl-terminal hydrolase 2-like [Salvia splendens]
MGKKVKKKTRSSVKEKLGPSMSPTTVPNDDTSNAETTVDAVVVIKDRGVCSHVDKGINLDKLSAKLRSSESNKCEDCRGNMADRRSKKGQAKPGKKGGTKAIWVCLECGNYACGGIGLPTTPQSHAVRHSKQNHHPLVVHYENHHLLWCFPCGKLVLGENSEDHKEVLTEVVKLLKGQPGEGSTVDVEDVWFGSASVTSAVKSDYSVSTAGKAGYSIRGLGNLGNTCFFNSVMQNLFAINSLRDYFFKLDESVGPLSAAMRKLFLETSNEGGSKGVLNPRSLFGVLCNKSPQFRGYQQHDSHELLRCLLDGMSTEELSFRKHNKSCEVSVKDKTFVDGFFGGKLSSTVSCLECCHASTIYEPFLDLSLPVPTKRPPPKRTQPPLRGKKPKLFPKRSARNFSKASKESNSSPRKSVLDQSIGGNSLALVDSAFSDSTGSCSVALDMGLSADDLSAFQNPDSQPASQAVVEQTISSDAFSWLDYLDPCPISEQGDAASETDDTSAIDDSAKEDVRLQDTSSTAASDSRFESNLEKIAPEIPLGNAKNYDAPEPGAVAQEQNASLQFEDEQSVKPDSDGGITPEGSLTEDRFECDGGKDQSSPSCSQICAEDSNTSCRDNDSSSQNLDPKVMSCQNREADTSSVDVTGADTEVSLAIVGNEQESLDFDGFGDMFNEPEESSGAKSLDNPGSVAKNGVNGNNTSESDADEVDNADAPVTVESCLAFFTKPEFLSKDEHAWQCDNCSRILREQRAKSRKLKNPKSDAVPNSCEDTHPSSDGKTYDTEKSMNSKAEVDPSDGGPLPHNEDSLENGRCKVGNYVVSEINGIEIQSENVELQATSSCPGSSEGSDLSNRGLDPHQRECDSEKDVSMRNELQSVKCETEVSEHEDVDSEKLKVKRDATKSILISKAPAILTIHLKRFSQDVRGRLSKLNGHVSFKESIHLKPYMDPRCSEDNCTPSYRLVGAVEHLGTMRGGHYVAYVRGSPGYGDDGAWYHVSDAYVRQASLDEVLRCEAYILFYERA